MHERIALAAVWGAASGRKTETNLEVGDAAESDVWRPWRRSVPELAEVTVAHSGFSLSGGGGAGGAAATPYLLISPPPPNPPPNPLPLLLSVKLPLLSTSALTLLMSLREKSTLTGFGGGLPPPRRESRKAGPPVAAPIPSRWREALRKGEARLELGPEPLLEPEGMEEIEAVNEEERAGEAGGAELPMFERDMSRRRGGGRKKLILPRGVGLEESRGCRFQRQGGYRHPTSSTSRVFQKENCKLLGAGGSPSPLSTSPRNTTGCISPTA